MAILKSKALIEEETLSELRQKEAEKCYAILEGWRAKLPITPIAVEPPRGVFREDTTPFAYDYRNRPYRNNAPQKRWSEI